MLPIAAAALVLVGAVLWLLGRPLPPLAEPAPDARIVEQIEALRAALAGRAALEGRVAALEARPAPAAPDLVPLGQATATASRQVAVLEERLAGLARELAARPVPVPDAALAGRIAALEAALGARLAALEGQLGQWAQQGAQATGEQAARLAALEAAAAGRIAALEAEAAARAQAVTQQAARLAALEGQAQRLAAVEGRSARLAALEAAKAALDAGRPVGTLPGAPDALARFAALAPPTESSLRLAFPEAARAARAASDPTGATVMDSAAARLGGLLTVRRGEEVLLGDAAGAEIERARRALEAGDLAGAVGHLQRLSATARAAMRDWLDQAEALLAARAALRQMAAG